ncbi:MAG TPA: hypothetical protein VGM64_20380 [Lacunisphaera sp.]
MKHINLFRALPVGCAIAAADYLMLSRFSRNSVADAVAIIVSIAPAAVFFVQIRLGKLPWFETGNGERHVLVQWLEDVFPWLRGPRR